MLIGLISDTHDHIPNLNKAVSIFRDRSVDQVIHSGDFCSPFMVPPFEGLPLQAVFGNNDGDTYLLMQKMREIGAEIHAAFFEKQLGGYHIAVYHGTDAPVKDALCNCGTYDVVVSGHTHEMIDEEVGGTRFINPGSAHGFDGTASIALLDTDSGELEFVEL